MAEEPSLSHENCLCCRGGRIDPNICSIDNNAGIDIPDTSALFVSLLSSVSSQMNLVKS